MQDIRNDGRKGIDMLHAELINDWLWFDHDNILPMEIKLLVHEPNNWEFRQNNDNTIDIIFSNDMVLTVCVENEKVIHISDNFIKKINKKYNNISKTFFGNFKYV